MVTSDEDRLRVHTPRNSQRMCLTAIRLSSSSELPAISLSTTRVLQAHLRCKDESRRSNTLRSHNGKAHIAMHPLTQFHSKIYSRPCRLTKRRLRFTTTSRLPISWLYSNNLQHRPSNTSSHLSVDSMLSRNSHTSNLHPGNSFSNLYSSLPKRTSRRVNSSKDTRCKPAVPYRPRRSPLRLNISHRQSKRKPLLTFSISRSLYHVL